MTMSDKAQKSPLAIGRIIQILENLSLNENSISLTELSKIHDAPKSSLRLLLKGLVEEGLVIQIDGNYSLGPRAFRLGSILLSALRRKRGSELIRDVMQQLSLETGETVLFAVPDEDGTSMTYVDLVESTNAVRFSRSVGDRRPLFCTAGGRMLLATRPSDEVSEYLKNTSLVKFTESSITDKNALAEEIERARIAGVVQTRDQAASDLTGTAAPVRNADGDVIGVLVVAAPSARIETRKEEFVRIVLENANVISRMLGYHSMDQDKPSSRIAS